VTALLSAPDRIPSPPATKYLRSLPTDVGSPGAHMVIDAGICARRPTNDVLLDPADQTPLDAFGKVLTTDGVEYEAWVDQQWQDATGDTLTYIKIRDNEHTADGERDPEVLRQREADTVEALRAAVDRTRKTGGSVVVFNGRLRVSGFSGEADAWIVARGKLYPVDVKHSKTFEDRKQVLELPASQLATPHLEDAVYEEFTGRLKADYDIQLVHYLYQAAALGDLFGCDVLPDQPWGAIIPKPLDGAVKLIWRRLDERTHNHPAPATAEEKKAGLSAIELHQWHYERWAALTSEAREHAATAAPAVGLPVLSAQPEKQTACGECRWKDACSEVLEHRRDVTLVYGVGPAQTVSLRPHGVQSISDLALLCERTAAVIDVGADPIGVQEAAQQLSPATPAADIIRTTAAKAAQLDRVGLHTAADLAALDPWTARVGKPARKRLVDLIDQARAQDSDRVYTQRGVDATNLVVPGCKPPTATSLGEPPCEVHYDLEALVGGTDSPQPLACDHVYLHGMLTDFAKRRLRKFEGFLPIYDEAHTISPQAEQELFVRFWQQWRDLLAAAKRGKIGRTVLYHYSSYEHTVLTKLRDRYADTDGVPDEDEFDALWTNYPHRHDLYVFIRDHLVLPTRSLSLKDTANVIGRHFWRAEDPSGANSIAWQRAVYSGTLDEVEVRGMQRKVVEYNEDDVRGQLALRERLHWLLTLGEHKVHPIGHLDSRYARRRTYVQRAS